MELPLVGEGLLLAIKRSYIYRTANLLISVNGSSCITLLRISLIYHENATETFSNLMVKNWFSTTASERTVKFLTTTSTFLTFLSSNNRVFIRGVFASCTPNRLWSISRKIGIAFTTTLSNFARYLNWSWGRDFIQVCFVLFVPMKIVTYKKRLWVMNNYIRKSNMLGEREKLAQ